MIVWAAGAVWRWATDQCPGGRKTTAVAIKGAVLILIGGVVGLYYAAPFAWDEYRSFRSSIDTLAHAVEVQDIRDAAAAGGVGPTRHGFRRRYSGLSLASL